MYVLNAREQDMVTFPAPVQKYLLLEGIPVYKRVGKTKYFRRSGRLKEVLGNAPLLIRLLSHGKEV